MRLRMVVAGLILCATCVAALQAQETVRRALECELFAELNGATLPAEAAGGPEDASSLGARQDVAALGLLLVDLPNRSQVPEGTVRADRIVG